MLVYLRSSGVEVQAQQSQSTKCQFGSFDPAFIRFDGDLGLANQERAGTCHGMCHCACIMKGMIVAMQHSNKALVMSLTGLSMVNHA